MLATMRAEAPRKGSPGISASSVLDAGLGCLVCLSVGAVLAGVAGPCVAGAGVATAVGFGIGGANCGWLNDAGVEPGVSAAAVFGMIGVAGTPLAGALPFSAAKVSLHS